jgi:ParB family chromosome partitioning protein
MSPAIISLLSPEMKDRPAGVRNIKLDHITPNPDQPRMTFDEEALNELAASIREHGVLQPILVRPGSEPQQFQLVAGERRWRAAQKAELREIPALIEDIDDDTALEIAIIENLQREDFSPLEEALMYERMTSEHGYSVRKLAQKIGKDKGYVENRMRLADAPPEIRELVSVRKDTLSHAYELMRIGDERTRRRLAKKVAAGELTLAGLRALTGSADADDDGEKPRRRARTKAGDVAVAKAARATDDALIVNRSKLADAIDELVELLRHPELIEQIPDTNRDNLARNLTVTKLKLENAIAIIRASREPA